MLQCQKLRRETVLAPCNPRSMAFTTECCHAAFSLHNTGPSLGHQGRPMESNRASPCKGMTRLWPGF